MLTMRQIRRYVEHYEGVPFWQTRDARLTDINLNEMKINYSGTVARIPFEPPMNSMREARERLVCMDNKARKALGRSDILVTKYIPPTANPGHLFNFTQCIITYMIFCRAAHLQPGSLLYDNLLYMVPGFARFCQMIQPYLFTMMVGIHIVESFFMAKKLARHGVTPFEGIWWSWTGSCFVEGVTSFWRLDGLINKLTHDKEAKSH